MTVHRSLRLGHLRTETIDYVDFRNASLRVLNVLDCVPNRIFRNESIFLPTAEIRFVVTESISISTVENLNIVTVTARLRTEATETDDLNQNGTTPPPLPRKAIANDRLLPIETMEYDHHHHRNDDEIHPPQSVATFLLHIRFVPNDEMEIDL